MTKDHEKKALNNRANQLNPNNPAYWSSRGNTKPTLRPKKK